MRRLVEILTGKSERPQAERTQQLEITPPSLQDPLTRLIIRFDSVPVETLQADVAELSRRWNGLLEIAPRESQTFQTMRFLKFKKELVGETATVVLPGMVDLRTLEDPTKIFPLLLPAVLTQTTTEPRAYSTEIVGIRPIKEDEPDTLVLDALEQPYRKSPLKEFYASLEKIGLVFDGTGTRLYVRKADNYYTLDITPYMSYPPGLRMRLKSRRVAPVTVERLHETLDADWNFFHNEAKQILAQAFPPLTA